MNSSTPITMSNWVYTYKVSFEMIPPGHCERKLLISAHKQATRGPMALSPFQRAMRMKCDTYMLHPQHSSETRSSYTQGILSFKLLLSH